ncbi:hypothetical protein VSH64_38595 [Amycolatopsis rhabdoformis]|uniref:PPE domain-containing protein n=1 Tax=Amycolatopsis rhabdoformis TaxID=1448059 RepID=A0ABZ1I4Y2_9PSEU|nr:hypothetical protein [Amycolatopsis rhabdoformis]WSE28690.1 hypothetical protein VSH64_38595 [Amycolatopsis rhabdoformis]
MGFLDMVGDGAKWVGDRFSDAGHWADDVWHGNVGDQAVPTPELVKKVKAGKGAGDWHQGVTHATTLATDHHQISADIQKLSSDLESVWTGSGAQAAQAQIRSFSDATATASQTFTSNSENLNGIAHGFEDMRSNLQPMPDPAPHKDFLDVATPWDTDTEDKINQYNQMAEQNLARYQAYADQAKTSGQGLQSDYGQLDQLGSVTIAKPTTPVKHKEHVITKKDDNNDDSTSTSQSEVDTRHITTPPPNIPPPTTPPPTTPPPNIPPPIAPPPTGRPVEPPGWKPPVEPGKRPGDDDDDSTQKSGLDDPTVTPPGQRFPVGSGNPSWSSTGGGADGFGPGGFGVGAGAGPGGAGGSGAFGSGSGRGAGGIGSRLSGGAGTGAFGEEGARGGAMGGRGGMAGAAGAKGSSGMGGAMGGGANRGKGEEDAEHQRKYGIDDDSAFTLIDDEDGRLLDPHTGLPPTPPTIGA